MENTTILMHGFCKDITVFWYIFMDITASSDIHEIFPRISLLAVISMGFFHGYHSNLNNFGFCSTVFLLWHLFECSHCLFLVKSLHTIVFYSPKRDIRSKFWGNRGKLGELEEFLGIGENFGGTQ